MAPRGTCFSLSMHRIAALSCDPPTMKMAIWIGCFVGSVPFMLSWRVAIQLKPWETGFHAVCRSQSLAMMYDIAVHLEMSLGCNRCLSLWCSSGTDSLAVAFLKWWIGITHSGSWHGQWSKLCAGLTMKWLLSHIPFYPEASWLQQTPDPPWTMQWVIRVRSLRTSALEEILLLGLIVV